jgi:hypothetical protein
MRHILFHEPSRGIGGVPERSGGRSPRIRQNPCGQTDKRMAFARRAELPVWGNSVNITKDVRKYAAEQGIAEEEAVKLGMEEKSKEFVEKGAEVYTKV